MNDPSVFDRPGDPVYHEIALHHVVELPVLGVNITFESNSAAAIDAVEETFGMWRGLSASPELIEPGSSARIRLIVHDGDEGPTLHAPVVARLADPDRLLIHTPGSVALLDLGRRDAVAYITPALLADRAHIHYSLLHMLAFPLAIQYDRYPVHAAVIARGPTALLLAGPAGTGKSTLALQAQRQGMDVLSDDVTYIQLKPVYRVWGDVPGRVYLMSDAEAHFPDLAGHAPTLLANGTEKLLVRYNYAWSGPAGRAPVAAQAGVCLLERNGGHASLAPATADEVRAFLRNELGIARTMFGEGVYQAVDTLAADGGWKLSLSQDPKDAVPFLETMLTALEQRD
ncbi:MAG TPA: hypothetical protein VGA20_12055 [Gemmatimonadales bacterium]